MAISSRREDAVCERVDPIVMRATSSSETRYDRTIPCFPVVASKARVKNGMGTPRPGLSGFNSKGVVLRRGTLDSFTTMTKEAIPLHRPDDLPPPHLIKQVKVKDDGTLKVREVWDYCNDDKLRQQHALELFRRAHASSKYSIGGQPGARPTHNVYRHLKNWRQNEPRAFYLLDLENAFPNIDQFETKCQFYYLMGRKGVGLANAEIDFLEAYMHEDIGAFLTLDGRQVPGAPQGNATSGIMLDLLMRETDYRLGRWFVSGTYTRWIDDLTFSTPLVDPESGKMRDRARRTIRGFIKEMPGVVINDTKSQNLSGDKPVTVTGITFNRYGLMAPSAGILEHATNCFDMLSIRMKAHDPITEHDINVFEGYRAALSIAGPAERSPSQEVRTLYNRSIILGNIACQIAAQQGIIPPRERLWHIGVDKTVI